MLDALAWAALLCTVAAALAFTAFLWSAPRRSGAFDLVEVPVEVPAEEA